MPNSERREAAKYLKGAPLSKKISYFWYYYKWHTIAIVFLIASAIAVYWVSSQIDHDAMNVVITDYYGEQIDTELLTQRYSAAADSPRAINYDLTMALNTSERLQITLVNEQKLTAMNSAGHLDVLLAPEAVFAKYASRGLFYSLDELLPADVIDNLLSDNRIVSGQLDSTIDSKGITGHDDGLVFAGIRLSKSGLASQAGIEVEDVCIGIPASSVRKEDAGVFLRIFLDS